MAISRMKSLRRVTNLDPKGRRVLSDAQQTHA
jgi:hypothetical protein